VTPAPTCREVVDLASALLDDLDRVFGEALLYDRDAGRIATDAIASSTNTMRVKLSDSVDRLRQAVVNYKQASRRSAPTREIAVQQKRSTEARTIAMLERFEQLLPRHVVLDTSSRVVFEAFARATIELVEQAERARP
jgi:hypothetical protein